jgi:hypothetical protein
LRRHDRLGLGARDERPLRLSLPFWPNGQRCCAAVGPVEPSRL